MNGKTGAFLGGIGVGIAMAHVAYVIAVQFIEPLPSWAPLATTAIVITLWTAGYWFNRRHQEDE